MTMRSVIWDALCTLLTRVVILSQKKLPKSILGSILAPAAQDTTFAPENVASAGAWSIV